ncbi:hypothetical protein H6F89_05030 [Cyanobacteria bacterium FACHB-63]|nr:hypothetical protein [Cyanobacteria bacterium FACHB-63]
MEIRLPKKNHRTSSLNWDKLSSAKHRFKYYRIPTTIEEFSQYDQHRIELQVNSRAWFLLDEAEQAFNKIVEKIHLSPDVLGVASYQTVYTAIKEQLQIELGNREIDPSNKRDFAQVLEIVQNTINSKISSFDFFFAIDGIDLKDHELINCGKVELFSFKKQLHDQLIKLHLKETTNQDSTRIQRVQDFFDENFLDRVCVKSSAYGDSEIAGRRAYKQVKEVINYFRFIVCVFAHTRITQQIVRINISSESYSNNERTIINRDRDSAIILVSGRGRKPLQKLTIDVNLFQDLTSNGFLEDFVEIINASSQTELEGRILTAIYWIGEAQNEPDLDVAFLKYWTALECIFTHSKNPTEALAKGVTVINTFSEYGFVDIEDIESIHSRIKGLYGKRSDIIHRGMNYLANQVIDEADVAEICKYTAWSILSLFSLRTRYTTMNEVDSQISRLSTRLKPASARTQFAICLSNKGHPASLEVGKLYRAIPDEQAASNGLIRVIDESGENYAVSSDRFYVIELPKSVEEALLSTQ